MPIDIKCEMGSGVEACGFKLLVKPISEKHSKGYDAKVVAIDKDGNEIMFQVIDSCDAEDYIQQVKRMCKMIVKKNDILGIPWKWRDEWHFNKYRFSYPDANDINYIATRDQGKTVMSDPKMAWVSKEAGVISSSRMPNIVYRPMYLDTFFETEVGNFKLSKNAFGDITLVNEEGFFSNGNEFMKFIPVKKREK